MDLTVTLRWTSTPTTIMGRVIRTLIIGSRMLMAVSRPEGPACQSRHGVRCLLLLRN